jgi:phage host-nuclease inhibitor protein Gam
MAKKATKLKSAAETLSYQTREEVQTAIKEIGDLQRELQRTATAMNDELAQVADGYAPLIDGIKAKIEPMQRAVQAWCECNRNELTGNGKTKTGTFVTGEVQWRNKPPSVIVRGVDVVLETLEKWGLSRFIRTKSEVNKEAVLAEPDAVKGVTGISIKSGVEEFVIKPFEQEVK